MARVSTYLNFPGTTEQAFEFYRGVFGTEYASPPVRMSDMPVPDLSDEDGRLIMHVELPITAGHLIMATDVLSSMGQECRVGNNTTLFLELDRRDDVDRLFAALSDGGGDASVPANQPWGQYWGVCLDRFGIRWMLASPI